MRVLVACEFSGIVRDAFAKRGHDAWSCDLLPTERPGNHWVGDIRFSGLMMGHWDILIAHPPCKYLANSGVRLLMRDGIMDEARGAKMTWAAVFFRWLLNFDCERIAVENPIPHKYAISVIGRNYDQIIQPWQFGHGETKATCLWLKNLPPLVPTKIVDGRVGRVWKERPSPDRWKNRSRTYQGIAEAMAEQWGSLDLIPDNQVRSKLWVR